MIDAGADVDAFGRYTTAWRARRCGGRRSLRETGRESSPSTSPEFSSAPARPSRPMQLRSGRGANVAADVGGAGRAGNGTCAELARVLFVAGARLDAADAAALALYRFGSAVSVVKSEIGA